MINVKIFVAAVLAFGHFQVYAGEFSKIDLVVRDELQRFFGVSYSKVWDLAVTESKEGCLLVVKAYVLQESQWRESTYETWSCVNRVQTYPATAYESEVVDFKLLSNQ